MIPKGRWPRSVESTVIHGHREHVHHAMEDLWIDYGPDWPPPLKEPPKPRPRPRRRRRRWPGFGLGTNIMILVGTVVICVIITKLADRPMQLNLKPPKPAAGTASTTPHRH